MVMFLDVFFREGRGGEGGSERPAKRNITGYNTMGLGIKLNAETMTLHSP